MKSGKDKTVSYRINEWHWRNKTVSYRINEWHWRVHVGYTTNYGMTKHTLSHKS